MRSHAQRFGASASLILTLALLTLAGCANRGERPEALKTTKSASYDNYLIGPGDNLNIIVWRNPDLSMVVPVRPDGKITTPLVEDLPASGKTTTQLAREIEKELAEFIQDPKVTVVATGFLGPFSSQVRVIGQAARPQALQYRENMSLMDVMIAVGGLTEFAAGNKASILRTVDGKQKQFSVRLNDLIKSGDVSANVNIQPGDVLIIPESFF